MKRPKRPNPNRMKQKWSELYGPWQDYILDLEEYCDVFESHMYLLDMRIKTISDQEFKEINKNEVEE